MINTFRMTAGAVAALLAPGLCGAASGSTATQRWLPTAVWARRPSPSEFSAAYPSGASFRNTNGGALIKCAVNGADGSLRDCRVLAETPKDFGFGQAVLKMSSKFRVDMARTPVAQDGDLVLLPVMFSLPVAGEAFRIKDRPGEGASLVSVLTEPPAAGMITLDCPSKADLARKCQLHPIDWAEQPTWPKANALLMDSDQTQGVSLMECKVSAAATLTACTVGNATARNKAALLELAKDFKAPSKAIDGTATPGARVVLQFNWALIHELRGYEGQPLWTSKTTAADVNR